MHGWYIISNVVTLIALMREVAAKAGFYAERMSSYRNWRQVTVPICSAKGQIKRA